MSFSMLLKMRAYLWVLAGAMLCVSTARAAYLFDSSDEEIAGTWDGVSDHPISMSCWVKQADVGASAATFMAIGTNPNHSGSSHNVATVTSDQFRAISIDGSFASSFAFEAIPTDSADGEWIMVAGVFASTTSRVMADWVDGVLATGFNSDERGVSGTLDAIVIGNNLPLSQDADGLVAECAFWTTALDNDDLTALGTYKPVCVQPESLIGYYPLSTNSSSQADASGSGGPTLTVVNATYSTDHPELMDCASPPTGSGAVMRRRNE